MVDPCDGSTTITLANDLSWPSNAWNTDDLVFSINPDTDITSVTTPSGADCGAFTIQFALAGPDGITPPETATITVTDTSYSINFNQDVDTVGSWVLTTTIYHTAYPGYTIVPTYTFDVNDPCEDGDAVVYTIDGTAVTSAW